MNLFVLSKSKRRIARYMVDKHICKMILESVQMLSSAKRVLDPDSQMGPVYKMVIRFFKWKSSLILKNNI